MPGKTFEEVLERFRTIPIDETFDKIVAVADGGIIPAAILNQRLGVGISLLRINLRDEFQVLRYDRPKLLSPVDFEVENKRILLVDDRVKSGATIDFAKELMKGAALIKTFAVNGSADYSLYDEPCFKFPWII